MTNEPRAMTTIVEEAPPVASAAPKPTRPFYWSVRRELWEHRSIWMAPSITAGILLFMFVLIMLVMARPRQVPALPYEIAPSFVIVAMCLVGLFYCLDALHGERRDRSILSNRPNPICRPYPGVSGRRLRARDALAVGHAYRGGGDMTITPEQGQRPSRAT